MSADVDRSLDSLSPRFRPLVDRFLARLVEAKIPVMIVSTLRTAAEQAEAVRTGHSKVKHSKHQDGDAIDVVPYSQYAIHGDNKLLWDTTDPIWLKIGAIGESVGMRWGGRFPPLNTIGVGWDPGHFEYLESPPRTSTVAA